MASTPLQPGTVPANAPAHPKTTRRAMLGILATPALAMAIPATKAEAVDRSAWDQAFAAMKKAEAASDLQSKRWKAISGAYEADLPDADAIDWKELAVRFDGHNGARMLDVDAYWADYLRNGGGVGWGVNPEEHKVRARAALDQVLEYQRIEKAADARHGYSEACQQCDDLNETACELRFALVVMPAPDIAAVHWKMDMMFGDDCGDEGPGGDGYCGSYRAEYLRAVLADLQRLAGEARHV